jgi:hypothetical protein
MKWRLPGSLGCAPSCSVRHRGPSAPDRMLAGAGAAAKTPTRRSRACIDRRSFMPSVSADWGTPLRPTARMSFFSSRRLSGGLRVRVERAENILRVKPSGAQEPGTVAGASDQMPGQAAARVGAASRLFASVVVASCSPVDVARRRKVSTASRCRNHGVRRRCTTVVTVGKGGQMPATQTSEAGSGLSRGRSACVLRVRGRARRALGWPPTGVAKTDVGVSGNPALAPW